MNNMTAAEMNQHLADLWDAGASGASRTPDAYMMRYIADATAALERLEYEGVRHPASGSALALAIQSMRLVFAAERRIRAAVLTCGAEESRE